VSAAGRGALGIAWRADKPRRYSAIQAAVRDPGGALSAPIVIDDEPSTPPAVALAPDGTGGDAMVAWIARRDSNRHYEVRARRRYAGRPFGSVRVLRSTSNYILEVTLAADEQGRMTAAWPEHDPGHSTGYNGITTSVRVITAAPDRTYGTPHIVSASGARYRQSLSIAAANGRVAMAWGYKRERHRFGVEAAIGPAGAPDRPQTVATATLTGDFFVSPPAARVALAPSGAATVLAVLPSQPAPNRIASRLLAVDGP
jgi:hypothetical protein